MKSLTPIETWYDMVIKSQAEFEIWYKQLDAGTFTGESVLILSGSYTRSDGKGLHLPNTLKQLCGIGTVLIEISNFIYFSSSSPGAIWYTSKPNEKGREYLIKNINLSCTANKQAVCFYQCVNLINCNAKAYNTGGQAIGFYLCNTLTNCNANSTSINNGNGYAYAYGFRSCNNLINCNGNAFANRGAATTHTTYQAYGLTGCTNLINCTGSGLYDSSSGSTREGFAFDSCSVCSNCRQDPTTASTTATWGGTNTNVDLYTCPEYPTKPPATISSIIVTRV